MEQIEKFNKKELEKFISKNSNKIEKLWKDLSKFWPELTLHFDEMSVTIKVVLI